MIVDCVIDAAIAAELIGYAGIQTSHNGGPIPYG